MVSISLRGRTQWLCPENGQKCPAQSHRVAKVMTRLFHTFSRAGAAVAGALRRLSGLAVQPCNDVGGLSPSTRTARACDLPSPLARFSAWVAGSVKVYSLHGINADDNAEFRRDLRLKACSFVMIGTDDWNKLAPTLLAGHSAACGNLKPGVNLSATCDMVIGG